MSDLWSGNNVWFLIESWTHVIGPDFQRVDQIGTSLANTNQKGLNDKSTVHYDEENEK